MKAPPDWCDVGDRAGDMLRPEVGEVGAAPVSPPGQAGMQCNSFPYHVSITWLQPSVQLHCAVSPGAM